MIDLSGQTALITDIFVANAGVWPAEEVRLGDMALKRWRTTVEANLDSVFVSTRAVLPLMRPGGRVVIDIAGPILFLCSDLARHVTGEVLNVNGGSVLCG